MTDRSHDTTSRAGILLFFLLSLALAGVVHVSFTEPAEERLKERRGLRQELETRVKISAAKRELLWLKDRALIDDPQTQERRLRASGWGRPGDFRLASIDENR